MLHYPEMILMIKHGKKKSICTEKEDQDWVLIETTDLISTLIKENGP